MNKNVRNILVGIILVFLILIALQNLQTTIFRFLVWRVEMPLIGVVVISGGLGFAMGKLVKIR